jgi:hypothetical protein
MSPTTYRARGVKQPGPELKRSRSQGTQRKLVKVSNVASTEDPNYSGGAVLSFKCCTIHRAYIPPTFSKVSFCDFQFLLFVRHLQFLFL